MSEPRGQLHKEHLTFPGCSHFADWMIIMRNVSPACMGVLRDVLGCPGVTSVLTGHRVCGMLRRGIGKQPWNDVFGRRTRKPLPPLPASPRGPVTSRVVRFSRPVTHLRLIVVRVGTLGRGRPRRSIPEMRHGLSVDARRHGVDEDRIELVCSPSKAPRHEIRVERARSPSPVCHERMEPSRSPSVPRGQERSPGVDALLD